MINNYVDLPTDSSTLAPGSATAANQVLEIAQLTAINSNTANALTLLTSIDGKLTSPLAVTGPLTDTQLRNSPVPISGTVTANLGTIAGVATEVTLSAINVKIPSGLTVTSTRLLVDGSGVTQPISAVALPLPSGAATEATLLSIDSKLTSPLAVTGPLTDTQLRFTPVPIEISYNGSPASPVNPLDVYFSVADTGVATELTLTLVNDSISATNVLIGSTTETAPGTDTGQSGLNGRLQRIAQNLTTANTNITAMSAKLPAALGIRVAATSLSIVPASDAIFAANATQTGTWNVGLNAGTALVGKVGIDQTTPGTTNGVSLSQVAGTNTPTGNGSVVSGGVQRVVLANDQTPVAFKTDLTSPGTTDAFSLARLGSTTISTSNGTADAGTQRVAIASNNTAFPIKIDQSVPGTTNKVSIGTDGTVVLGAGTAGIGKLTANSGVIIGAVEIAPSQTLATVSTVTTVSAVTAISNALPAGNNNIGDMDVASLPAISAPSAALSNVASSASNVTLIASNANRKGAMIYNDSTQAVFVKFGATATSSSFTVKIAAGGYYEFPQFVTASGQNSVYTGIVDGIWVSANGNARITEMS